MKAATWSGVLQSVLAAAIAACVAFIPVRHIVVSGKRFADILAHVMPSLLLIVASVLIAVSLAAICTQLEKLGRRVAILKAIPALLYAVAKAPLFWVAMLVELRMPFIFTMNGGTQLTEFIVPAVLLALVQVPAYAFCLRQRNFSALTLFGAFAWLLPTIISADVIVEIMYAQRGESRLFFRELASPDASFFFAFVLTSAIAVIIVRAIALTLAAPPPETNTGSPLKKSAVMAGIALACMVVVALIASVLLADRAMRIDDIAWRGYPIPPCFVDARACGGHLLGSDENARDLLARLIVATRYSLGIPALALVVAYVIAGVLAALSRLRSLNKSITVVAHAFDAIPRFPTLIALLAGIDALLQHNAGFMTVAVLYGIFMWPRMLFYFHNTQRSFAQWLRRAASDAATVVLLSATVDFFGFGVQPPNPSWGAMLVNTQASFSIAWWTGVFPGVSLFASVLLLDMLRQNDDFEPMRIY